MPCRRNWQFAHNAALIFAGMNFRREGFGLFSRAPDSTCKAAKKIKKGVLTMTDENGIENLENHKSEENSRVGASHDLDGKFLRGHKPLPGAGRPKGSRSMVRDVLAGSMNTDAFRAVVDQKLRIMAMGSGKRSVDAGVWYLKMASHVKDYNRAPRRRRKKG